MRFSPPDLVSFDVDGRLFENPGVQGRYAIDGDLITVTVDGGPAGCGGQQFAMRASLPDEGLMHFVHTQPGTGACSSTQDERWVMEQVLPMAPFIDNMVLSTERGWQPLTVTSAAVAGGSSISVDVLASLTTSLRARVDDVSLRRA